MNARTRSRRSSTAAMIADMREALQAVLGPLSEAVLLPGGASKEAGAVDADGQRLLVRRAGGGVIHRHTLSLRHEFEVLQVAHAAGVKVPRPVAYIDDLEGREAFVMERLEGETIGRRIVRMAVPDRLPEQMAEELAKIHALPPQRLPVLEDASIDRLEELDYWELAGNVAWAIGCLTQARRHLTGQERSVELAILGRLGAEVEHEICHLLELQGVT